MHVYLHPTRRPAPSSYRPTKGRRLPLFRLREPCATLLCRHQPPPPIVAEASAQHGETDRQRDACQCRLATQLKIRRCSVAGRDFSETPSFTLMGLVVGGLRLRATTEEASHKKKKYNLHLFIIKEELGKLRMPPLSSSLMPRQRWMDN